MANVEYGGGCQKKKNMEVSCHKISAYMLIVWPIL